MTVEASMAVPIFLFFLINILFSFDMLRIHGNIAAAMHQTGNKIAFYGYAYKSISDEKAILGEGLDSLLFSEGYARKSVINLLGEKYLNNTCLTSGVSGLHFIKSSVMQNNDIIELTASYKVRPFVKVMGFPDFPMENKYYGRAWTGYDVEGRQNDMTAEDPIVYVTDTGEVYHGARNCTYLNPSVEAVLFMEADELRNEGGGKYHTCDRCGSNGFQAVAYITSQGNRIHGSVKCPGLKRTIYVIHLSEVGSRRKCLKCS